MSVDIVLLLMMGGCVSQKCHSLEVALLVEKLLSDHFNITLEVSDVATKLFLGLLCDSSQGLHENFRHIML